VAATSEVGTETPVGLFGLVRQMTRVLGESAAMHVVDREGEVRRAAERRRCGRPAPSAHAAYMSNAGWTMMASQGSPADPPRSATTAASRMPSSSPLVSSSCDGSMPKRRGAGARHGIVVRIDSRVLARERSNRVDHPRRAARGVLVQVQPQPTASETGRW
jgi:hypothetical protein